MIKNYFKEHYLYLIKNSKYEGTDLLRFFAVFSVLLYHYNVLLFNKIFRLGWTGVDLFFVLSGFLIGGAIIDEYIKKDNFSFIRFYKNRALRIYPIYILATILTIYFNIAILKSIELNLDQIIKQSIINISFLQTYIVVNHYYIAGGTWSLVIEWFFYLIIPTVLILLLKYTKKDLKKVLNYSLILYFSAIFVRFYLTKSIIPTDSNSYFLKSILPTFRYDELVAGLIVALIIRQFSISKKLKGYLLFVSLFTFSLFASYVYKNPQFLDVPILFTWETLYFPTLLSFSFGCLLLSLYNIKINLPIINVMARLSYAIYLLHIVFGSGVILLPKFMIFVSVLGISYLASLLVEYPFLRMYKNQNKKVLTKVSKPETLVGVGL